MKNPLLIPTVDASSYRFEDMAVKVSIGTLLSINFENFGRKLRIWWDFTSFYFCIKYEVGVNALYFTIEPSLSRFLWTLRSPLSYLLSLFLFSFLYCPRSCFILFLHPVLLVSVMTSLSTPKKTLESVI